MDLVQEWRAERLHKREESMKFPLRSVQPLQKWRKTMWRGHNKGSATAMGVRLGIAFRGEKKRVKILNLSTHFPGYCDQWVSSWRGRYLCVIHWRWGRDEGEATGDCLLQNQGWYWGILFTGQERRVKIWSQFICLLGLCTWSGPR